MELDEIMKAFDAEIGIESVPADEDGAYHLQIDGIGVMVMTIGEGRQLGMFAEIGDPPAEGREILYRAMLESMAPGGGCEGMTFSILHNSGRIALSRTDPLADTDYAAFRERLEKLVNTAEDWRRNIADFLPFCEKVREAAKVEDKESLDLSQSGFMQV